MKNYHFNKLIKNVSRFIIHRKPEGEIQKKFYINDRNFSTKYSLCLRKLRKSFYHDSIKLKKIEQEKNPVPKILYSTS